MESILLAVTCRLRGWSSKILPRSPQMFHSRKKTHFFHPFLTAVGSFFFFLMDQIVAVFLKLARFLVLPSYRVNHGARK